MHILNNHLVTELELLANIKNLTLVLDKKGSLLSLWNNEILKLDQIILQEESKLELYLFLNEKIAKTLNINIIQHKNSQLKICFIFNNCLDLNSICNVEIGSNCTSQVYALILNQLGGQVKFKTNLVHTAGNSKSTQLIKALADQKGSINIENLIEIKKDLIEVDAQLLNRNLILSNFATVSSKPFLKIKSNQIKCSHGVSSSIIDTESAFYLSSRGLLPTKVRNLIISSFKQEIMDQVNPLCMQKFAQTPQKL